MEGNTRTTRKKNISQHGAALGVIVLCVLLAGNIILTRTIIADTPIQLSHPFAEHAQSLPSFSLSAHELASLVFTYNKQTAPPKQQRLVDWDEPAHILILGLPGAGNPAPHLADTIMVLHVNPEPRPPAIKLISVPRDLFVSIDGRNTRINELWRYAVQSTHDPVGFTTQHISTILGIPITHIVVFDLATVRQVVEHVDGITVTIDSDVHDPRFPVARGQYETFELVGGSRYLNAEDALRFIRTRATPRGDFDRMHRQQLFIQALKGKVASLNPVWDFRTLWRIYATVKDEVITTITPDDARALWRISNIVPFGDVDTLVIDEVSGLVRPHSVRIGRVPASVLVADQEDMFDYTRIQEAVKTFLQSTP